MPKTGTTIGRIVHKPRRGWLVNKITVPRSGGTVVEWTCSRTSRYVVLLPRSGNPLGGKFTVVRPASRTGRASYRMPAMRVARGTRIPYLILLQDGDTYRYVSGNSAPIIIVW